MTKQKPSLAQTLGAEPIVRRVVRKHSGVGLEHYLDKDVIFSESNEHHVFGGVVRGFDDRHIIIEGYKTYYAKNIDDFIINQEYNFFDTIKGERVRARHFGSQTPGYTAIHRDLAKIINTYEDFVKTGEGVKNDSTR